MTDSQYNQTLDRGRHSAMNSLLGNAGCWYIAQQMAQTTEQVKPVLHTFLPEIHSER